MAEAVDQRRIFFTNLRLLGCDVRAYEAKYNIPFNKDMFNLPNKRGAEVVLYFLFTKLNPAICREEFRDCWPVTEKKQEAQFRKTCTNWLTNISKEEPDAHLPRIAASLFLAPGGEKFYQLLFHLSTYVLQKTLEKECGTKVKDLLRYPTLTQQNIHLAECISHTLPCGIVRKRKKYLNTLQQTVLLNKEWKDTASELVKNHRKLTKDIRELEHRIRTEQQKASESSLARGSPVAKRTQNMANSSFTMDPRTIKRTQRVQQVQDMWKQFDKFCQTEAAEREVIESIVEQTMKKHKIDATEIGIKVPDLLLRECEEEIRRRHIDNTFNGGKLNLVSVIQLWNLCLHLYIEKIQQAGIPKFETDVGVVTAQVHTHHAYLFTVQTLRKQVKELLPELKGTVESLRSKMESGSCKQSTPKSIRSTCIGVGFTEPTPPVSFTPQAQPSGYTPDGPMAITTPEAALQLAQGVTDTVRKNPDALFPDTPVYNPVTQGNDGVNRLPTSKLPKPVAISFTVDVGSDTQIKTSSSPLPNKQHKNHGTESSRKVYSKAGVLDASLNSSLSSRSSMSHRSASSNLYDQTPVRNGHPSQSPQESFRSESTRRRGKRSPADIIADEVMNDSYSRDLAFVSRDLIHRSPVHNQTELSMQEELQNRSTVDQNTRSLEHDPILSQRPNSHHSVTLTHGHSDNIMNTSGNNTESYKEVISRRNLGEFESAKFAQFNGFDDRTRNKTSAQNFGAPPVSDILDYEEPLGKACTDRFELSHKMNEISDMDFNKNSTLSPQYSMSPVQLRSLEGSLESPRSGNSQRASVTGTPPGSLRGSLKNSPRQSPRSLSAYLNVSGQQNKTQRTPIEQEVRRMWHAALSEKEGIHTRSLPLQLEEDFLGSSPTLTSDVGLRLQPDLDSTAGRSTEDFLGSSPALISDPGLKLLPDLDFTAGRSTVQSFSPRTKDQPHSEVGKQTSQEPASAPGVLSPINVLTPAFLTTSFELEENLEDIEMPNLELHESLEDFFTPPPKTVDTRKVESLSSYESSISRIDFPANLQSMTSDNDMLFLSHPHSFRDQLPSDDYNDHTPKLQRSFRTQKDTIAESRDGEIYPQNQISEAEKRYLRLKQQLQKEELKRPEDFTVAGPLKFKLEDFDLEPGVDKTNNSTNISTSSFSRRELKNGTASQRSPVVSVLEDQEDINVEEVDINLLSTFDDSFAPVKTGLFLEGGTPDKKHSHSMVQKSGAEDSEDDLIARFQKLKVAASAYLNN
ncbi:hypothetical protein ScPMuIL_018243 [Solemya velum]